MALKGYEHTREHNESIRKAMFGIKHTKERCLNISNSLKGKNKSEKTKINMSLGKKNYYKNHKSPRFGVITPKTTKEKLSEQTLKFWSNSDNKKERIKKILKGLFETRPTSLEQEMINICKKYNLPIIYTGDGSFLIGYKNPDFVCKDKKVCIEVANTFHHSANYPEERINYFKQYGWDCLVFRTDKLNENLVVKQVGEKMWH